MHRSKEPKLHSVHIEAASSYQRGKVAAQKRKKSQDKIKTMSTKTPNLKTLIKAGKYDWVNSEITPESFPPEQVRGEIELIHPKKYFTLDEGIAILKDAGLEPVNAYELLSWAAKDHKKVTEWTYTVALATIWRGPRRRPRVVCVDRYPGFRGLSLFYTGFRFDGRCVLAGVRPRKPSGAGKLKTSGPVTLSPLDLSGKEIELTVEGRTYKAKLQ